MGILDGIVEWIAEQVMAGLDLVTTSVLGRCWAVYMACFFCGTFPLPKRCIASLWRWLSALSC